MVIGLKIFQYIQSRQCTTGGEGGGGYGSEGSGEGEGIGERLGLGRMELVLI